MNDRTLSVVIAAYNRGSRIARTLDSVLAQSTPASEIVVVDDGSADETVAFIRANYPGVRVIENAHGGQSIARNTGAEQARGDIVVFLDSDDALLPHALITLLDGFRDFPSARAVFADHRYENSSNGAIYENHHYSLPQFERLRGLIPVAERGPARLYDRSMYYTILNGNLLQQPWAIYRADFLESGGFAPELKSNEDWDLYLRLAYRYPLVLTDTVISTHYVESSFNHVHLSAGQDRTNMQVIRRQLRERSWSDPRATAILRRRLAMYLKTAGDRERPSDLMAAWRLYLRSLAAWPFDHVVAARTLLWPLRRAVGLS